MQTYLSLGDAQRYMVENDLDGWLVHDFQRSNPVFWQIVGGPRHTTRRCFLFVPADGQACLLLHHVDENRLADVGWPIRTYLSLSDLVSELRALAIGRSRLAMEYSPLGAVPVISRVDAGTVELVRSVGIEVVSSAELLQYAADRWTPEQLVGHRCAAQNLSEIVLSAFRFIGDGLTRGVDELSVAGFIKQCFSDKGLTADDGPTVAVNAHTSDPHYEPTPLTNATIGPGDWVLIDLWARLQSVGSVYADITWVAYVGETPPDPYARAFETVLTARDMAIEFLRAAARQGRPVEGWEVDRVSRQHIEASGYGPYFTHRLGHSLGLTVHGNGVNLDDFETRDTRRLIIGLAVTVEPGVYLPAFGVRSEVNVYIDTDGPVVTTPCQSQVFQIV